jgi:hypothetical protein
MREKKARNKEKGKKDMNRINSKGKVVPVLIKLSTTP